METSTRLSREQDGVLRRLTYFERCGLQLSSETRWQRFELRARDRRRTVREPWEESVTAQPGSAG